VQCFLNVNEHALRQLSYRPYYFAKKFELVFLSAHLCIIKSSISSYLRSLFFQGINFQMPCIPIYMVVCLFDGYQYMDVKIVSTALAFVITVLMAFYLFTRVSLFIVKFLTLNKVSMKEIFVYLTCIN
jgi:energy-converting hydrogenase Eha subunit C